MLHIDDAERIPGHGFDWRPLRKALGTTAFGINAYTADAGGEVIETHDELSQGAAGHEELYVVIAGGGDVHGRRRRGRRAAGHAAASSRRARAAAPPRRRTGRPCS